MTIQEIQNEACKIWGITIEDLLGGRRRSEHIAPRKAAMVAAAEIFEYAMSHVDRAFGAGQGMTRHYTHAKGKMPERFIDVEKTKQLRATCQQRKNKMLESIPC